MNQINLKVPNHKIDMVLDTDAFNEIDDQFAIAYALRSSDKCNVKAFYAAPFLNHRSKSPEDGMEKSYQEIIKVLELANEKRPVFKGSKAYLPDEKTPIISDAANDLIERAMLYTKEHPLYVVAIGAITNIASALLLRPQIAEHIVIVWLGGHAHHFHDTKEFNMFQDYAAARVVMGSGAPFVQLPCAGVVSAFSVSGEDMDKWLVGKNALSDYLAKNAMQEAHCYTKDKAWTRVIWDVTAVAWLLNDNDRFLKWRIEPVRLPSYDGYYEEPLKNIEMCYVYYVNRDALWNDLIDKLTTN